MEEVDLAQFQEPIVAATKLPSRDWREREDLKSE